MKWMRGSLTGHWKLQTCRIYCSASASSSIRRIRCGCTNPRATRSTCNWNVICSTEDSTVRDPIRIWLSWPLSAYKVTIHSRPFPSMATRLQMITNLASVSRWQRNWATTIRRSTSPDTCRRWIWSSTRRRNWNSKWRITIRVGWAPF